MESGYDVGNRDGVIINNWIEGANDGFFFEISRGATVAGNVFCAQRQGDPCTKFGGRACIQQHVL